MCRLPSNDTAVPYCLGIGWSIVSGVDPRVKALSPRQVLSLGLETAFSDMTSKDFQAMLNPGVPESVQEP